MGSSSPLPPSPIIPSPLPSPRRILVRFIIGYLFRAAALFYGADRKEIVKSNCPVSRELFYFNFGSRRSDASLIDSIYFGLT